MSRLDGRVAIVTGAGRGIGAAVAKQLAAEGAAVVVNDLGGDETGKGADLTPAQTVVKEITEAGGTASVSGANVADYQAVGDMIHSTIENYGGLHILVNTAGILRDKMIFNLSEEDWDAVIATHLKGHYNTIHHASQHWREQRNPEAGNRIINFTSVSGLHGAPAQPNYAAAKMGIFGLTMSCANGLIRYGVTTNAISPGANTRLSETVPEDQRGIDPAVWAQMTPDKVAPVVSYIAGPESGWLNGRIVDVRFNNVALYNIPEQVRVLTSKEPWTTESVGTQMELHFKDLAAVPIRMPL
jgi:NAD(P)-dependent dehydrogenase (short-subunit alcohol dehydrogenase family)